MTENFSQNVTEIIIWSIPFMLVFLGFLGRRFVQHIDKLSQSVNDLGKTVGILSSEVDSLKEQNRRQHEQNLARMGRLKNE